MSSLNVIKTTEVNFDRCWRQLRQKLSLESELVGNQKRLEQVRQIIAQVRQHGDKALAELTAAYDNVQLEPEEFRVSRQAMHQAHRQMDPELLKALRRSIANVRDYQQAVKISAQPDWTTNGMRLGLRYRPLQRVGVCVPGASAPLVSTVIMTVVPAQVAGVEEIVVISSPSYHNSIHPAILGLCYELNVNEVYRVSGAQAVAALAFGTRQIAKVDKIVGPSNWWGQLAKKEVFGLVDIDSFAGPSDVLIIADDSADPQWLAADMLSQAEHAPGSAVLVTDSENLALETAQQLELQLNQLSRAEQTRQCVRQDSLAVVAQSMDQVIALANEFAPEHLQVQTKNSDAVAEQIVNAGAIFIGYLSPVATGDYYAGPSHTLPVGGSSRFFSALSVNDFLKQSSIISLNQQALNQAAADIDTIALTEGLDAHARSVQIRIKK